MEEQLRTLLSSVAGGRVYWGRAPQGAAYPNVVLTVISGIRDYHMQGPSGYVESRVQADVYAESYGGAKSVARDIEAAVSGHSDTNFQAIFIDGERDLPADDPGAVTNLYRVTLDLMVHH